MGLTPVGAYDESEAGDTDTMGVSGAEVLARGGLTGKWSLTGYDDEDVWGLRSVVNRDI